MCKLARMWGFARRRLLVGADPHVSVPGSKAVPFATPPSEKGRPGGRKELRIANEASCIASVASVFTFVETIHRNVYPQSQCVMAIQTERPARDGARSRVKSVNVWQKVSRAHPFWSGVSGLGGGGRAVFLFHRVG